MSVDPELEETKIVVVKEAFSRESVPKRNNAGEEAV